MPKRIAVLLDGGHVRVHAKNAGLPYTPGYIEKVALACPNPDEEILRILYYDCAPYAGAVTLPVSGTKKTYQGTDQWMRELAHRDLFAVRRRALKFRGFALDKNKDPLPADCAAAGQ